MSAQPERSDDPARERAGAYGIELPPMVPITPEELERRRILVEEILALREKIDPIGINGVDLIDMPWHDDDDPAY